MIIEKWKNAQTYVIGKMHVTRGLVCQDRTWSMEANGVKVIALADGAGSKEKSEIGAEIVTKRICELLCENFVEYLMMFEEKDRDEAQHNRNMEELSKTIISSVMASLKAKAMEMNLAVEELSSTMLFFATKDNHYILGHVGDGVIAGLYNENNANRVRVISDPENGEKSNVTFFVPDSNAYEHLRLDAGDTELLRGIVLTSDGAGGVLFSDGKVDGNVLKLFSNFQDRTTEEYEQIISKFLKEIVGNYSTDDLSLNILTLEDSDTEKISEDYYKYLLAGIKSKDQVIRKSQYCVYLDPSVRAVDGNLFATEQDLKEYLKWQ